MQYIRQSMVALSVLFIGVGCSENRTQKELTEETIRLNNTAHTLNNDTQTYKNITLLDQGAINPKTQYLKKNKDVEVAPKTDTVEQVTIPHENDVKTIKLISERDATIMANLEMEKVIANLKSEKLTLNEKIEQLMKAQKEHQRSSKDKITASASALLAAQQLTADRDSQIAKLRAERDEAIKVTLEMQKASADLEAQKLNLDGKIQTLLQSQSAHESSLKEKINTAATAVEQLTAEKDAQIEALKLTQEQTERALEERQREVDDLTNKIVHLNDDLLREKESFTNFKVEQKQIQADLEAQRSELDGKIQTLMQTQSAHESSLKEKITTAATAVEQLTAKKDAQIAKLIQERDEAIKITLEMQKNSTDLETQKSELSGKIQTLMQTQNDNDSSTQEKMTKLTTLIAQAEKMALAKDQDAAQLVKERDAAIQVSIGLKKDYEAQKLDLEKQIETLKQDTTQSESLSNEKINNLTTLLEEAKQTIIAHDADLEKLTKERDAAIQVSMGMQKKLDENAQKLMQEKEASEEKARQGVIDNIVSTFKLSKVEFKTGSAILTNESTLLLDKVAEIMKNHTQYNYKIQGHTDSQGLEESNLELSNNRAQSVKEYLISKGISEDQLSAEGFGALNPIADNATPEGRLKNRRVVFEIID